MVGGLPRPSLDGDGLEDRRTVRLDEVYGPFVSVTT